jgi:hypothetical protein
LFKLALIGGAGVGKSTLAFTFGKHLEKQGLRIAIANMDPACRHITYKPSLDIRDWWTVDKIMKQRKLGPHGALGKVYELVLKEGELLDEVKGIEKENDVLLLDTAGSLEMFLLENGSEFLRRFSDAVLFMVDNTSVESKADFLVLKAINTIQKVKYALPTLTVVNKCDLIKESKLPPRSKAPSHLELAGSRVVSEHLEPLLAELSKGEKLVFTSATLRRGYEELFDAINEIRCECGEA